MPQTRRLSFIATPDVATFLVEVFDSGKFASQIGHQIAMLVTLGRPRFNASRIVWS